MDKRAKAGYITNAGQLEKFFIRVHEAETALGKPMTREEREHLFVSMQLGKEITLEELKDMMAGKKVLIVKDKNSESL
jgi:hypothetical protein